MDKTTVSLNGFEVTCDVALSSSEHVTGLQKHASLKPNEGMLFIFPNPQTRTFHMGEVKFPIDMVAIDHNSVVTKIVESAMPRTARRWTFPKVSGVLEVPAFTCRRAKLKVGDVVTAFDKHADGFNEQSPQTQEIHNRETDKDVEQQYRDRETPDKLTQSSPAMYDEPKEQYFHELWPEAIADEAIDVRPELETRVGHKTAADDDDVVDLAQRREKKNPGSEFDRRMRMDPDYAEGLKQRGPDIDNFYKERGLFQNEEEEPPFRPETFDAEKLNRSLNEAMAPIQELLRKHREDRLRREKGENVIQGPWPKKSERVAQIVDEQKFVHKVAPILFAHADQIPWADDSLNGGATQRAVVARSDLAKWLSGNPETSQGAAEPGSAQYILQSAGTDRGMRLIGNAFVLADLADFSRVGFRGREPTLVLYREPNQSSSQTLEQPSVDPSSVGRPEVS